MTYFCSPRGARAPNPALITAQSPCRRSRAAQIRLGGPYRNWLHYFSGSSAAAAHSTRRLLIWDKWPGSPPPRASLNPADKKKKKSSCHQQITFCRFTLVGRQTRDAVGSDGLKVEATFRRRRRAVLCCSTPGVPKITQTLLWLSASAPACQSIPRSGGRARQQRHPP